MKEYTVIWEDRWQSGSHHHCLTKATWIKCSDIKILMESEYGNRARYIYEGFQLSLGEELRPKEVVELG